MGFKILKISGTLTDKEVKSKINKVGLDANVLINTILTENLENHVSLFRLVQEGQLCTSKRAFLEAVGVLKYQYNHKNANREVLSLTKKLNMEIFVERTEDMGSAIDLLNKYNLNKKEHWKDMMILATLKRNNVTHLVTKDKEFKRVAKKEGLIIVEF